MWPRRPGWCGTRVPDEDRPGLSRTRVWTVTATMNAVTELADHLRCHQIEVATLGVNQCFPSPHR